MNFQSMYVPDPKQVKQEACIVVTVLDYLKRRTP